MQEEIDNLKVGVREAVTPYWVIFVMAMVALNVTGLVFAPVAMMGFAAFYLISAFAPAQTTLMDNTEEVRQSAGSVANIERLSIQALDERRYYALQSGNMLQKAVLGPNLEHSQVLVAKDCQQKLDAEIEKAVKEIHGRNQAYSTAEKRLKKTEHVQKRAQGMNSTELVMIIVEEGKQYSEEPKTRAQEEEESTWCPCCQIM